MDKSMKVIVLSTEKQFVSSSYLVALKSQNLASYSVVDEETVSLTINTNHWVGRVVVDDIVIVAPPPFDNKDFLRFLVYAEGFDLSKSEDFGHFGSFDDSSNRDFFIFLALTFVLTVQRSLGHNISKGYIEVSERNLVLRGRPLFKSSFGKHPSSGVACQINRLSMDNELNRIILFGLKIALVVLFRSDYRSKCSELIFLFRCVCSDSDFDSFNIDLALAGLKRNNEHYRSALVMVKYLIQGCQPNFFEGVGSRLPNFELYLPSLFENFVFRLIKEALRGSTLSVKNQASDNRALIDGDGRPYRRIIPDIVISEGSTPRAVLDSKFKPRYFNSTPKSDIPRRNKVSNSDIYQVFFYQQRLVVRHKLKGAPKAVIVAPSLYGASHHPDVAKRTIIWPGYLDQADDCKIVVLPLPLKEVLKGLVNHGSAREALKYAPELAEFCSSLVKRTSTATENQKSPL